MVAWATNRWRSIWHLGLTLRSGAALFFAVGCVGIATALRIGLGRISPDSAVFAPYYSATLVATLVGGAESGILAAALGALAAYYLFVPLGWGPGLFWLEQLVSLVLYSTSSVVIIWAAQSYRGLMQQLRANETAREPLNRELVHRIKNILANVQGIVGQSLADQKILRNAINARITALGATHDLLVRSNWHSAPLREILIQEFAPYGLSRFQLHGDDVDCPSALAVFLALVVHELTTNALKYGALSSPDGRIDIAWTDVSGQLMLEWVESGGPEPTVPTHEGFGTTLLRSGARQFQGAVDCRFEQTGLRCRLSLFLPKYPEPEIVDLTPRSPRLQTEPPVSSAKANFPSEPHLTPSSPGPASSSAPAGPASPAASFAWPSDRPRLPARCCKYGSGECRRAPRLATCKRKRRRLTGGALHRHA
jgi:two-component sensor histidine kinase